MEVFSICSYFKSQLVKPSILNLQQVLLCATYRTTHLKPQGEHLEEELATLPLHASPDPTTCCREMSSRTNPDTYRVFSGNGDRASLLQEGTGSSELEMEECSECREMVAVGHCSQAGQDTTRRSATASSFAAEGFTSFTVHKLPTVVSKAILTCKKNSIFFSLVLCPVKLTRLERQNCSDEYQAVFLSEK